MYKNREDMLAYMRKYNKTKRGKGTPEYEKFLKEKQKSYHKHKKEIGERRKITRIKLKIETIKHYSKDQNKCNCCGEKTIEFLTIDHINNDGNKHRKEINSQGGNNFYSWLRKRNYPKGLQVLCFNCNCAKGHYGSCPHTW